MKLNTKNWKEFRVGDLFTLVPTKGVCSEELLEGKDIPYIAAKHDLNGLAMMCQKDGFENWISPGNCIVFINLGAGSAGYVNYIKEDFIGMSGKTTCGYINGIMNEFIGQFLSIILSCERPKYSFGRSWTGDRLKNTIIKLPTTENGEPDWQFMEDYIKSLHYKPLTTKNKKSNMKLNVDEWREFKVSNLFEIEIAKSADIGSLDDGKTPFIGRTNINNGVQKYVAAKDITRGNCISLSMVGTNVAQWQSENFQASQNIATLRAPQLNSNNSMFICTLLNNEMIAKYSYGRTVGKANIAEMLLRLPTTENGEPDWQFMEDYIKSLPYGDKLS